MINEQRAIEIAITFVETTFGFHANEFSINARYISAEPWRPKDHWAVVFTHLKSHEGPIIEIDPDTEVANLFPP